MDLALPDYQMLVVANHGRGKAQRPQMLLLFGNAESRIDVSGTFLLD